MRSAPGFFVIVLHIICYLFNHVHFLIILQISPKIFKKGYKKKQVKNNFLTILRLIIFYLPLSFHLKDCLPVFACMAGKLLLRYNPFHCSPECCPDPFLLPESFCLPLRLQSIIPCAAYHMIVVSHKSFLQLNLRIQLSDNKVKR